MKGVEKDQASPSTSSKPRLRDDLECGRCGRAGAYAFAGKTVCLDCYASCGSCCAEAVERHGGAEGA